MKYHRICQYVSETPWAITMSKLSELVAVLSFRAGGGEFTPEEIQARIGGGSQSSSSARQGAVAIIPVHGVIAHRMGSMDDTSGGTSTERIGAMVDQVASDPNIGTIVYDFDTPGGTVTGVQELAAKMFSLRGVKKQVAHINSMAASAGYWLAAQADEIVSTPSGMAGSIGVYSAHQDMSKALEAEGIDVTLISAGKYKVEGSPFAPLSDEAKAFMQARVDEAYSQFIKDVARGRGVSVADVRNGYGEGRALSAKDAKAAGLIDKIATFDETLSGLTGRKQASGMRAESLEETMSALLDESDRLWRLERF
jgi:signal peptide peptidase SppA